MFEQLWRVLAGLLAIWPSMPYIYTDFFASRFAGQPMKCESFPPGQEPTVSHLASMCEIAADLVAKEEKVLTMLDIN